MKEGKEQGFSLIEVLVAVAVLSLVIGPLLYSFVTAARINSSARRSMEATAAAQNTMEQIKAGAWEDLGFTKQNDGTYTRETTETVNGQTFHVKAKLDPSGYKRDMDTEPQQYNDLPLPDIYRMDRSSDALYIQDTDTDQQAAASFYEDGDVFSKMKRSIVLYIKENAEGKPEVTLDIKYDHNSKIRYQEKAAMLFRNTSENQTLRSVYLFFQPMYTNTSASDIKEEIFIINEAKIPVEVYLVKQENSRTSEAAEQKYRIKADVAEQSYNGEAEGGWIPLTRIKTNLVSGQLEMTYNGQTHWPVGATLYPAEVLVGKQALSGQVTKERIYEVKVEVSDDTGETKAVLTGTKEK